MKNMLKGFLGYKLLRGTRSSDNLLARLGGAALLFRKSRGMLLLTALGVGAEYLRRRQARRHAQLPQVD